jgi:SAM-dependent methyltransferase
MQPEPGRIFSGLILSALQKSRDPRQTIREARYIEQLLEPKPLARLLDVPCGHGRIAIELGLRGYCMSGIDHAPELIEQARQDSSYFMEPLIPDWRLGDMRQLPWEAEFDGAYCFWESFGYFDDAGNLEFLKAVHRALKPGGRFLLDTHVLESMLHRQHLRDWSEIDGMFIMEERSFDPAKGMLHCHWVFVKDGRVEHRHLPMRLYTYRELLILLQSAGFSSFRTLNYLTNDPFQPGGGRLVAVVVK